MLVLNTPEKNREFFNATYIIGIDIEVRFTWVEVSEILSADPL